MAKTYTCSSCGAIYICGRNDDDVLAEYHRNFPGAGDDEKRVVCDDCYTTMRRAMPFPGDAQNG